MAGSPSERNPVYRDRIIAFEKYKSRQSEGEVLRATGGLCLSCLEIIWCLLLQCSDAGFHLLSCLRVTTTESAPTLVVGKIASGVQKP